MTNSPTIRDTGADSALVESRPVIDLKSPAFAWVPFAILLVAAFFRFAWLDLKPAHHDEGVVACLALDIGEKGFYEYNPENFHGPLPFYLSFVSHRLFGHTMFGMRFHVVLLSTLAVGLILAFREYFSETAVRWAALAMAVSPGMVYFGRQCAHEMGTTFFNILIVWGAIGLARGGTRRELWATGMGFAGMVLSKETYAIHAFAILLAIPALLLLGKIFPLAKADAYRREWKWRDAVKVTAATLGIIVFFYSGTFMDWKGVAGLWETWSWWVKRGVSEDVQDKRATYYLEILWRYEWPVLLGIAAAVLALRPDTSRNVRFAALIGLAGACGYNIVSYKVPWLAMSWMWPFFLTFGLGVAEVQKFIGRKMTTVLAGGLIFLMAAKSWHLNFHNYAPPQHSAEAVEPYAYVQSLDDLKKINQPLAALTAMDPAYRYISGAMIGGDQYPMVWHLAHFPRIGWYGERDGKFELPDKWNLDFIQAHVDVAAEVEGKLREAYYVEDFQVRNMGGARSRLYFRAATFAPVFGDRTPECIPTGEFKPPQEAPR